MAISRKRALERLESLSKQVELHLDKLASEHGSEPSLHWKGELRNFLHEMERMLPHIGRRTAAQWTSRIGKYKGIVGE